MTLKASQACAACKYQRRRCSSDCPLAPYFPADQPRLFQNAHKLFGRSNILSIIKPLDAERRAEAMRSIIYEANIRDRYPVHGCLGVVCQLQYQIWQVEAELRAAQAQLDMYRQMYYQQQLSTAAADDVPSQLELGMALPYIDALSLLHNNNTNDDDDAVASYSYNSYSSLYMDARDVWVEDTHAANNNNGSSMAFQSQLVASQPLEIQQEVVRDCDEMHPFFDTVDDRQSYVDSKEAYESSSEESLKDTTQSIEHVGENELKTAAACFTLTSVN
ncbi:LOB domain-containing protein 27 [Citrus sinensis]|uniref:LOB domain-containing protein n=1 Tax=Citrus unshiu TaxID=55188 RepID=A0A2H5PHP4_CITUN|nr:LOB domain-containing protein 27-like [Citrus sinensis]KAH9656374.1 LOB domain-containing protein 27 [Citrus sinensis]GAY51879.1 hypothetical protein CUMW_137690 [Citrus unshiu]